MRAPAADGDCDSATAPSLFALALTVACPRSDEAAPHGRFAAASRTARIRHTVTTAQFPFHCGAVPGAASAASPRPAPRKPS
jgi:hypothetical protein